MPNTILRKLAAKLATDVAKGQKQQTPDKEETIELLDAHLDAIAGAHSSSHSSNHSSYIN